MTIVNDNPEFIMTVPDDFPGLTASDVNNSVLYAEIQAALPAEVISVFSREVDDSTDLLTVEFATALSGGDETTFLNTIAAHTGEEAAQTAASDPEVGSDRAPTVNDDETKGHKVGDDWHHIDDPTFDLYRCFRATAGQALWKKLTLEATDSSVFGGEQFYAERTTPHVHTDDDDYQDALTLNANGCTGGTYVGVLYYEWAIDSTSRDFIGEWEVDGSDVACHRQEAKESGGSDGGTGSGTNQRHVNTMLWRGTLSAGNHTLRWRTKTEDDDYEVTTYRARMWLYRVGD